jgi:SpoVK/Ycf46/Vps4 family AAA+-type ATPase
MRILLRGQSASVRYKDQEFEQMILRLRQERPPTQATLLAFTGMPKLQMGMAAKELAASLGLALYRIDLQEVISTYIGETEKSLQRVFDRAAVAGQILFFDDGDTLFGERTNDQDKHNRRDKLEKSHLPEMLTTHRGIIIALFQSIGEAERRRNGVRQLVVKFPPH